MLNLYSLICGRLEITPDPFDLSHINNELLGTPSQNSTSGKKTPHSFLGENSALVNLDNLVTAPTNPAPVTQTRPPGMYFKIVITKIIICVLQILNYNLFLTLIA